MAITEECSELREGVQASPALRQSGRSNTKAMHTSQKRRSKALVRKALSPQRCMVFPFFLEIISGSGRLGKTIAQHIHWPVLLWDIEFGENYDLLTRSNQQLIKHRTSSGYVKGGHLGTPCHSFSRARDQPGGPPRLRSDKEPLGLDNLRPADMSAKYDRVTV